MAINEQTALHNAKARVGFAVGIAKVFCGSWREALSRRTNSNDLRFCALVDRGMI